MNGPATALRPGPGEVVLRSVVLGYVTLLIGLPLVALVLYSIADGWGAFLERIGDQVALDALVLTLWTSLLVGAVNTIAGAAIAWVLVRYRLPGRVALSALIDLPLAIPTLVAGLMIAVLYGPTSLVGARLSLWGLDIVFARPGIVLALLFVTLPFVVRAVEPILRELDPAEEEAARLLGAGPIRSFVTIVLPSMTPAAISGGLRSLGRALGEFGSIVIVAGNIPRHTLTAPVYLFGEIESGAPRAAAAVSTVLLAFSLALYVAVRVFERRWGPSHAKS